MVFERVAVAACGAQPEHLPIVDDLRLGFAEHHRADLLPAIRQQSRRAVRFENGHMAAEPAGVAAACGKAPTARHARTAPDRARTPKPPPTATVRPAPGRSGPQARMPRGPPNTSSALSAGR